MCELVAPDELREDLLVEVPVAADVGSDVLLAQPALAEEELGHGLRVRTPGVGVLKVVLA